MLYLIGYDARGSEEPSSTRLRTELADLQAEFVNRCAWILRTGMAAQDLAQYFESFVDGGALTVVDITD